MIECVIPRGSVLCTRVYLPLDSPKYIYIYIAVQSWSGTAEWIKVPYTDDCWTVHFLSLVATYVCQSQRQLREAQWQAWSPSSSQYNQWTSGRAPVWCMHVHIFPRENMYTTFLKKQNVWYSCRFGGGGALIESKNVAQSTQVQHHNSKRWLMMPFYPPTKQWSTLYTSVSVWT